MNLSVQHQSYGSCESHGDRYTFHTWYEDKKKVEEMLDRAKNRILKACSGKTHIYEKKHFGENGHGNCVDRIQSTLEGVKLKCFDKISESFPKKPILSDFVMWEEKSRCEDDSA